MGYNREAIQAEPHHPRTNPPPFILSKRWWCVQWHRKLHLMRMIAGTDNVTDRYPIDRGLIVPPLAAVEPYPQRSRQGLGRIFPGGISHLLYVAFQVCWGGAETCVVNHCEAFILRCLGGRRVKRRGRAPDRSASRSLRVANSARRTPAMGVLRQLKGVLIRNLHPDHSDKAAPPDSRRLGCFFTVHFINAESGCLCDPPVYTSTMCTEPTNPSWTDVDHLDMRVQHSGADAEALWARGVFGIRVWSCATANSASENHEALSPSPAGRGYAGAQGLPPRAMARRKLRSGGTWGAAAEVGSSSSQENTDCSRNHACTVLEQPGGNDTAAEREVCTNGVGEAVTVVGADEQLSRGETESQAVAGRGNAHHGADPQTQVGKELVHSPEGAMLSLEVATHTPRGRDRPCACACPPPDHRRLSLAVWEADSR